MVQQVLGAVCSVTDSSHYTGGCLYLRVTNVNCGGLSHLYSVLNSRQHEHLEPNTLCAVRAAPKVHSTGFCHLRVFEYPLDVILSELKKGLHWFSRHVYAGFHISLLPITPCPITPPRYCVIRGGSYGGASISLLSGGEVADQRAWSSGGVPPDSLYGYRGGWLLLRLYCLADTSRVGALAPVLLSFNLPTFPKPPNPQPWTSCSLGDSAAARRWERLISPGGFYVPLGSCDSVLPPFLSGC